MKKAFTLVELLVVLAMISALIAAMAVSTARARERAKISRATQETREITNAILAYEQYAPDRTLEAHATGGGWQDCTESSMKMILGGETGETGSPIPVLYNAAVTRGALRDPWGRPYQFLIQKASTVSSGQNAGLGNVSFKSSAALPNFWRLSDEERSR